MVSSFLLGRLGSHAEQRTDCLSGDGKPKLLKDLVGSRTAGLPPAPHPRDPTWAVGRLRPGLLSGARPL